MYSRASSPGEHILNCISLPNFGTLAKPSKSLLNSGSLAETPGRTRNRCQNPCQFQEVPSPKPLSEPGILVNTYSEARDPCGTPSGSCSQRTKGRCVERKGGPKLTTMLGIFSVVFGGRAAQGEGDRHSPNHKRSAILSERPPAAVHLLVLLQRTKGRCSERKGGPKLTTMLGLFSAVFWGRAARGEGVTGTPRTINEARDPFGTPSGSCAPAGLAPADEGGARRAQGRPKTDSYFGRFFCGVLGARRAGWGG